jgi:hydrogenase nickel incorporation protein HypB
MTGTVAIEQSILTKNDELAAALRARFRASRTFVVNLLSSPGSGKTTLLEETLRRLAPDYRVAALVGDQATENDAVRLKRSGAPVRQITTGEECRLDADMIGKALEGWDAGPLDALFIENVGNLICPAEYDLGEDFRAVLFSVTEGEDKPLKYPHMFAAASVLLLSKMDLLPHIRFDVERALSNALAINPGLTVFRLSAYTGEGMDAWYAWLRRETGSESALS